MAGRRYDHYPLSARNRRDRRDFSAGIFIRCGSRGNGCELAGRSAGGTGHDGPYLYAGKMEDGGVPERGTDASTDINEFQAYNAEKINDHVKQAVDETANQVITYQGQLIKAWFFADGGGRTAASALEGLSYDKEETPYIQSVEDPGAALPDNPNTSWETYFFHG